MLAQEDCDQTSVTIVEESNCYALQVVGNISKQHPIVALGQVMLEERKASWMHLSMIAFSM